ncbi:MAG: methyltransferase [Rhodospirillales bacterium]|nr:methyltransferase [Rhodospirillales bacterium]
MAAGHDDVTEDTLLDGRIRFRQPASGYRVGIDPVFLAAAVPARNGERVLDVGAGAGAAALCLAARVPGVRVTGLDFERTMVRIASENAKANGMAERVEFFLGNLLTPPIRLTPASFDHVMANPPYAAEGSGNPPPDPTKAAATVEGADAGLGEWLRFCLLMVRPKGTVTLIHRADRLADLLAGLTGKLGDIAIFPLWPTGDGRRPAKRILISGRRGVGGPLAIMPGLLLHEPDGSYTAAADRILRRGEALASARPGPGAQATRP